MYADVAVCLPLSRTFVYKLAEPVEVACRVVVPFRKRPTEGFVVRLRDDAPKDMEVHAIDRIIDTEPLLRPDIFELCRWISEYYVSPLGEVLKGALPPGISGTGHQLPKFAERISVIGGLSPKFTADQSRG